MAFNSNNMKDLFDKNNFSKIPKELEWENMEKGIFDKMEAMEKAESKKNRGVFFKRNYPLLALLLGGLSLGVALILLNINLGGNNKKLNVSQQEAQEAKSLKREMNEPLKKDWVNQDTASEEAVNQHYKTTPGTSTIHKPLTKGTNNGTDQPSINLNQATTNQEQSTFSGSTKRRNSGKHPQNSQGQKSAAEVTTAPSYAANGKDSLGIKPKSMNPLAKKNSELDNALDNSSATKQGQFDVEDLANGLSLASEEKISKTEKVDSTNSSPKNELATQLAAEKQVASEKQASPSARKQLILEGGITFWNEGSSQNMPNKNRYEKPLMSFQIQGNYSRGLNHNFFFMTGFQYQQLESRFEYSTIIPDYVITLQDTVVQVRNNLLTGRQEKIYGDVQQTVEAERNVVHYNTTQLFKVSLALGKSWYFNGMQADVYLGTALNTLAFNTGRTLVREALTDYSGRGNSVIENNYGVEGFAGARFHYFLDPRTALTGGFQVQKSLTNWTALENTRLYPISIGLQLGVSYNLEKP